MKLSLEELRRRAVGKAMGMGGDGTGGERGEEGQGGCGQGRDHPPPPPPCRPGSKHCGLHVPWNSMMCPTLAWVVSYGVSVFPCMFR